MGHLDVQTPSLAELLTRLEGAEDGAVVVPLLLGDGYHRAVDVPGVVAAAPGVRAVVTPGLSGAAATVGLALHRRLREAEERAADRADAVVMAAAGSTRPGGNDGALAAAAQLELLLGGGVPVRTAYCSAARPTVPHAVAELRAEGYRRVAVAAHLLAPGRFTAALPAAGAWAVTAPLADHPLIARAVLRRYALGQRELTVAGKWSPRGRGELRESEGGSPATEPPSASCTCCRSPARSSSRPRGDHVRSSRPRGDHVRS
ncbi:sirohydrochlorin chelatase [Kitasatospora sp. NPDC051853]|uniref:sirohydrochlorin chelatase n=1 Tax=Kitasatospora sp. NPDC051853 TaxID=3364058 RepID=UPI0037A97AD0